jgi:O-antigen/teichoic acid export membrane protein
VSSARAGAVSGSIGFISRAIAQLMLFGVTIVATRTLSIADFGAYSLASLFLILARALFYVGPYEFMLKAHYKDDLYGSCLVANMVLATVCAFLLVVVHWAAPLLFAATEVATLVLALAPSIFLVALTSWYETVLLRAGRVRRYYVNTLAGDVCSSAVAAALLLHGFGLDSLVAQTYVRLLVLLAMSVRACSDYSALRAPRAKVREILRWSRARYAAVMLNFSSTYGADLVLGVLLSPAATGLYRASSRIISAASDLFVQPLQKIAQTNLSARYKQRLDNSTIWLKMLSGVGTAAWSALAALALLANDIVPLVLGTKWLPAVPIVIAFCVIKAFSVLDAVTTSFLVCHDRQRDMLRVQLSTAIAVLVLSCLATPFGPVGVALAAGTASIVMSIVYVRMVMRESRAGRVAIHDLLATSIPPVVAVTGAIVLLKFFGPAWHGITAVAAGSAVAAITFAIAGFFVRHRMIEAIGALGPTRGSLAQPGR